MHIVCQGFPYLKSFITRLYYQLRPGTYLAGKDLSNRGYFAGSRQYYVIPSVIYKSVFTIALLQRDFLSETSPAKQFQLFQPIGGVSAVYTHGQ